MPKNFDYLIGEKFGKLTVVEIIKEYKHPTKARCVCDCGGETNAQMFEQKFGETPVELFGEGYGVKIQKGGAYRDDVDFILFDVLINDNYQPRESVEDIAKYFGIDVVPVVLEGTLQEGLDYVLNNRNSIIAKNGAELEGLVGRTKIETKDRTGKRNIVKIKYRDIEA